MTLDRAFEKIRKCLALAASGNSHEASAAMRHAQALMRKYGVDEAAVELSQVKAEDTTTAKSSIPGWVADLAWVVASAFACRCWFTRTAGSARVTFIGVGAKPKIATYAFTVLRRQLAADRAAFYRRTRGKRSNRIGRADQFALSWIYQVSREVSRFAGEVPAIVDRALHAQTGLKSFSTRRHGNKAPDYKAISEGARAGQKAQLRHGVNGDQRQQIGCGE